MLTRPPVEDEIGDTVGSAVSALNEVTEAEAELYAMSQLEAHEEDAAKLQDTVSWIYSLLQLNQDFGVACKRIEACKLYDQRLRVPMEAVTKALSAGSGATIDEAHFYEWFVVMFAPEVYPKPNPKPNPNPNPNPNRTRGRIDVHTQYIPNALMYTHSAYLKHVRRGHSFAGR